LSAFAQGKIGPRFACCCCSFHSRLVYTPLLVGIAESGGAKLSNDSTFIQPEEIASKMKDLIEQDKYRGGTALGVYRPGDAVVVANGSQSELEVLAPSDTAEVRDILKARR
jgi:hypothetical protein